MLNQGFVRLLRAAAFTVPCLFIASLLAGCGGSSAPVSIAITSSASTVDPTDTVTLTAAVTNDKNNGGVTWTVSGGGTLSNTTTTGATYTAPAASASSQTATITATSVADTSKTATASITVPPAPSITTGTLPPATVGTAFSETLAVSGGISPYTWTLSSGTLPSCLTLTAAGVLSGTPVASCAGTANLTFKVTDSGTPTALSATEQLTITINGAPTIVLPAPATLLAGVFNVSYTGSVAATGGAGALTYSITSGSLPTGLTLTAGAITGTPTAGGTFNFTIKAADAFGDSATQAYSLTVTYPAVTISTASPLPAGYAGTAYSEQLAATGGAGAPYTYTVTSGASSLAAVGLSLSGSGVVSGTTPVAGTASFTAQAKDAKGNVGTATISVTIDAGVSITTTSPLPVGYAAAAYSKQLAATGGAGSPYTWTVTSGSTSLTAVGLSLSSTGLLSGTTPVAGTASFTAQAKDSAGNTASMAFSVTIDAGVSITTTSPLPLGYAGVAYSRQLAAIGGAGTPYTWSVTSGASSLSAVGLTLSSSGLLSGTTPVAGTASFTAQAKDSAGNTGSTTFSVTINAGVAITTASPLPVGYVGTAYSLQLAAAGGAGAPYTYTVTSGASSLTAVGLSLSSSGLLSGSTPVAGPASFTVQAKDSSGNTGSATLSVTIDAGIAITTTSPLPVGYSGTAYSQQLAAKGGAGTPYTWTVTSGSTSLTAVGLSLSSTGLLSSTTPVAGTASFTTQAKDSAGNTASTTFSVTIDAGVSITTKSPLPAGIVGTAYSQTLAATGGAGTPYTWSVTSGASSLSAVGLSLSSSGVVAGAIPVAGAASFTAQAKDSAGNTASTAFSVTINAGVSVTTPSPLPVGYVGTAYSQQLAASGGAGTPYTWTVTSGSSSLAAVGLSVSSAGVLSGPTPIAGPATFTVQAKDSAGDTGSATLSVTIDAGVTITTTSPLPVGYSGTAYSQQLAASGGAGTPYTWTVTSGTSSLTAVGLSLSSSGLVSGTTPVAGTASFTTQAKDSAGNTASMTFSVTIDAGVIVTTKSPLPAGIVGTAYSQTLAATGGTGTPYTWSVTSGASSLSAVGLSLSSSGVVAGAIPIAGTASFTAQAKDSAGNIGAATFSVTINAGVTITTSSPLPAGVVGVAYSQTLAASGGTGTPYTWTVTTGATNLTAVGLSLSSAGVLSGPTPISGSASFTVQAKDSAGNTGSSSFSVTINTGVTVTTGSPLPAGYVGVAYSDQLTAGGGAGAPYTWTVTSGSSSLTALGLSVSSSGLLSGATPVAGTASFTVQAKDSANNTGSATLSVTVNAGVSITTKSPLPAGIVGTAYSDQLAASGGAGTPYTWTVTSGSASLTAVGLSLSSAGLVSGATPVAGSATFTVQAKDSVGNIASATFSVTVDSAIGITTASPLPAGIVGTAYSQTFAATGGAGTPYTWTVTTGSTNLTAVGLSLSSAGVLSAATPIAGSATFTVQAKDSLGNTATASFSITIDSAVSITTTSPLPAGIVGTAYSQTFAATGGAGTPYTWTVTSGSSSLTAVGLSLSSAGVLSGATPVAGTASFTVQAKDSAGNTASATFSVTIDAKVAITTTSPLPTGVVGTAYSQTFAATGGTGTPYTWTVTTGSTNLTAVGLSLSSAGVLSGATPIAGSATFTVQAKDSGGNTASASFSVTVNASLTITTTSLPSGTVGIAYSQPLAASGGTGGNAWSVSSGSSQLTAVGLTLSSAGVLSGATPIAGSATFTAQVKDSANDTATQSLTVNIYNSLALSPGSLPGGTTGLTYGQTIAGSGGSGSYCYTVPTVASISSGMLHGLSTPLPNSVSCAGFTAPSGYGFYIGPSVPISGTPTSSPAAPYTIAFNTTLIDLTVGNSITRAYTIAITSPPALSLPTPNPGSLPSATVNAFYNGSVGAIGGAGTYTWTVNGSVLSSTAISLNNGNLGIAANGSSLTITGTPNTLTNGTPISFTASVADSAGQSTATDTYTIAVTSLATISGQIVLNNYCGTGNLPPITVSINTSTTQSTTTDTNGNFSFSNIPNGSYTVTPSITGAESVFYPATQNVTVSGNPITGLNFGSVLGYTVSGNVNYGGPSTGQTYVVLNSLNCGSGNGTSMTPATLTAGGAFSIRGVQPGSYTLQAWMDTTGQGSQNIADPAGKASSNIDISTANVNAASVTMSNPTVPVPTSGPSLQNITPTDLGVAINFSSITTNGEEAVTSYTVEWSTSSSFTSPSSINFAAIGTHSNVWILNNSTAGISGSFVNGTKYYFRVQGNVTAGSGPFTTWGGATPTAVTIGAPSGTGYHTIAGSVTIPSSITPTGPLYVGVYNQNTGAIFATRIASPSNSAANSYTVSALADSSPDYFLFAILDQNNNGLIDVADVSNTNNNNSAGLAVAGNLTGQDVTLPTANSTVSVTTQYSKQTNQNGTYAQYALSFDVREGNELPVSVTLMSGPNVIQPIDMGGNCQGCGTPQWQYYANISPVVPVVGQAYTFLVTYSNGTTQTLTGTITGVLTSSDLATNLLPDSTGASTTPTFTWTDPANASSYIYQFSINPASGGNYIWQIPGNNSNANGFSSAYTTIVWPTDPTGGGSTPTQASLTSGTQYNWSIELQDANGNQATAGVQFTTSGTAPLSLPTPDPSSLGPAIVGQTYNGSITASGGVPNYTWTVNGAAVNPNGCTLLSIGDGLSVCNSNGSSTLSVTGSPTSAQTVSFSASVTDSTNATDSNGTVTYTINIGSSSPLTLPDPATNTGSALVGYPYGASLQAQGGSGSGYVFTLNGTALPTNGTLVSIGNGLSASSSGGSGFNVSGTPTTTTNVTFTLAVKDSVNDIAGPDSYTIDVSSLPNGVNNSNLNGRYVCESGGFTDSDGTLWASLSSFQANGSGTFTSGVFDTNGTDFSAAVSGTVTGTYSIAADNNGIATLTSVESSSHTVTTKWAFALTNAVAPAQEFRMVEIDDVGASPSGRQGQADCYLATTSAFAASTVSGHNFVYLANGEDSTDAPKTTIGSFDALNGNITAGALDQAVGIPATATHIALTGGSYTLPTSPSFTTNGRYTLTLTSSSGGADFVVYVIDSARMFTLKTDAASGTLAGHVRTQQQTSYSAANVNGNMVFYFQGLDASAGAFSGYNSSVLQATGNGAGSFNVNESYSDNFGTYSVGNSNGTYPLSFDNSNPGRVTFVPGGGTGYLYLYNNNAAGILVVDGNGDLYGGFVDPQTQTTFTDAALAGTYMLGQFPPLKPKDISVGEIDAASNGNVTGNVSTGGQNSFTWDDPQSGLTDSWLSTTYGAFSVADNGNPNSTCIVISSTKFVCISNNKSTPILQIFQQ